jgi:catechol 2,3-dioxygenase-like lactoylglutathione lyase family enzyme
MLQESHAFSGYSVQDMESTLAFYGGILGLTIEDTGMGLKLHLGGGATVFLYVREHHEPAAFTVLNFPVDSIDEIVDALAAKGVVFEHYPDMPGQQDEKQILRGKAVGYGPDIAWFKDPSGNILSVLQN